MRNTIRFAALVLSLALIGFLAYWFQPWRLFTSQSVSQPVPTLSAAESETVSASDEALSEATEPLVLATGTFISHEHETSGAVEILELTDGTRVLRIEGLKTSDGPDLKVWLADAPVIEGVDGWYIFDDGEYLSLGSLIGNQGDQNYAIPAGADLSKFSSVSIWCERFAVSFGAADLDPQF